jgi:hypothetical protein
MAGLVNLRAKNQEAALQRMMYIQQFLQKSGVSGNEPSNVERVMSEQEDQALKEKQFERQRLESEQRINIAQSEHDRKMQEFDENLNFRQKQEDFDRWQGTEQVKRGLEKQGLEEQETKARLPLLQAQTEETHMRTRYAEQQTLGQQLENDRKSNEGMVDDARRRRSLIIAKAQRLQPGQPLSREDTDDLEDAERVMGANPHYQVDRNPDGTLKNTEALARSVIDKDGNPSAQFAKDLHDADKPYNSFSQLLSDAKTAQRNGADKETMAHYADKIWQETAPTLPQVEGYIMKQMLDEGNISGAMDYANAMRKASAPVVKIPDPRERIDYKGTMKMVSRLDDLTTKYLDLKKRGKIPVGYLRQPFFDVLEKAGKSDPEIEAFRMQAHQFRAKYTLFLSGRATTNEERADIQKQIPSVFNSQATFEKALPEFMNGLKEDAAIDMGIAQEYGQKIPQGVPVIRPADVLAKGGKLPKVLLEHGAYLSNDAVENHVRGQQVINRRLAAQGVGGIEANSRNFYRNYGKGEVDTSGGEENAMSTETAPGFDPTQYTDAQQAAAVYEKLGEELKKNPGLREQYPDLAAQFPE